MAPRTIIICRHGERTDHANPALRRQLARPHDAELTEQGMMQAAQAGAFVFDLLSRVSPGDPQRMLANTLVLSSPLVRTVQTSESFVSGFEQRAAAQESRQRQEEQQQAAQGEQQQQQEATASTATRLSVHLCDTMLEGAYWMNRDLQMSGRVSATQPIHAGEPVFLSDEGLRAFSPRVTRGAAEAPVLRAVEHAPCNSTGGWQESEEMRDRMAAAAEELLTNSAYDDKVVVLIGHGISVQFVFEQICEALGNMELFDDANPDYTALVVLGRFSREGGDEWRHLIPPLSRPHLGETEMTEAAE